MKDKPDTFQVAKDYFVEWDHNLYMVPEGSETDFASIPERVRTFFAIQQALGRKVSITEVIGKWTEPSVVHDAAYRNTLRLMLLSPNRAAFNSNLDSSERIITLAAQEYDNICIAEVREPVLSRLIGGDKAAKVLQCELSCKMPPSNGKCSEDSKPKNCLEDYTASCPDALSDKKCSDAPTLKNCLEDSGRARLTLDSLKKPPGSSCPKHACLKRREADDMFLGLLKSVGVKYREIKLAEWALRLLGEGEWCSQAVPR